MDTPRKLSATLTLKLALEIKALLWRGYTQTEVADMYGVTQPTISRIVHGLQYHYVAWPDGSVGEINLTHYRVMLAQRKVEKIGDIPTVKAAPIVTNISDMSVVEDEHTVETDTTKVIELSTDIKAAREHQEKLKVERSANADALDALGADIERRMNAAVTDVASTPGESKRMRKRKAPKRTTYKIMPWDKVLEKSNEIPMVIAAEDNEIMQKAIGVVFKQLPVSQWGEEIAINLVADVAERMRKEMNDE